jgi:hypothetical protein
MSLLALPDEGWWGAGDDGFGGFEVDELCCACGAGTTSGLGSEKAPAGPEGWRGSGNAAGAPYSFSGGGGGGGGAPYSECGPPSRDEAGAPYSPLSPAPCSPPKPRAGGPYSPPKPAPPHLGSGQWYLHT